MKYLLSISLVVLLAGCIFSEDDASLPSAKEQGNDAFEKKEYKTSIEQYGNAYGQDSTDSEAYMGLVRSYVELMEPDSLLNKVQQDSLSILELYNEYTFFEMQGYFDSLEVLNEIVSDPNSPALQNLTEEERAELETIRLVSEAAGSMDEVVDYAINNQDQITKMMNGDIDQDLLQELFVGQDSAFVNDLIENLLNNGMLDSFQQPALE